MRSLPIVLGRRRDGAEAGIDLVTGGHVLACGETRSGKSVLTYSMLGQAAAKGGADVRVVGIDPTAVLLKPFSDRLAPRVDRWIVRGENVPGMAVEVISAIRDEMGRRLALIDEHDIDKLERFSPRLPLLVVVLEELPGIIRALTGADRMSGAKPADRLCPKFLTHFETLAAEAAKVGIRLVCLAQRPDADILGGYTRAQLTTRISFRFPGRGDWSLVFPDLTPDMLDVVEDMPPGLGFYRQPGMRSTMFRADYIADYRTYADHVRAHDLDWLAHQSKENWDEQVG